RVSWHRCAEVDAACRAQAGLRHDGRDQQGSGAAKTDDGRRLRGHRYHPGDGPGVHEGAHAAVSQFGQDPRPHQMTGAPVSKWRLHGVRVVHANELDTNTPQTPGMNRAAAITHARAGAEKLWAGTVVIHPKAKTGAHHHGPVESVIYVVSGRARMKWGDRLEFVAEAGPGDFIYVPPYVPHQEINASDEDPLSCVLVRSGQEPVVVNLDIPVAEEPQEVHWVDDIHPSPKKR